MKTTILIIITMIVPHFSLSQNEDAQHKIEGIIKRLYINLEMDSPNIHPMDKQSEIYNKSLESIANIGNPGISYLLELLFNNQQIQGLNIAPRDLQEIAIKVLIKLKVKEAIPFLLKILKNNNNNNEECSYLIYDALEEIGDIETVPELISIFEAPNTAMRSRLCSVIIALSKEKSIKFLLENVQKYPEILLITIDTVCTLKAQEGISFLLEALHKVGNRKLQGLASDVNNRKKEYILEGLYNIGTPKAIAAIFSARQDRDKDIRICAIKMLSKMKTKEAVAALQEAQKDPELAVQLRATAALIKLGFLKTENCQWIHQAVFNHDLYIQSNAVLALGEIEDTESLPILYKLREKESLQNLAQVAILKILQKINAPAESSAKSNMAVLVENVNCVEYQAEQVNIVNQAGYTLKQIEVQLNFSKNLSYLASTPPGILEKQDLNEAVKWKIAELPPRQKFEIRFKLKTLATGPAYRTIIIFKDNYIVNTSLYESITFAKSDDD